MKFKIRWFACSSLNCRYTNSFVDSRQSVCSSIRSFVRSVIRLYVLSSVRQVNRIFFIHSFSRPAVFFVHSFVRPSVRPFFRSSSRLFIRLFVSSIVRSFLYVCSISLNVIKIHSYGLICFSVLFDCLFGSSINHQSISSFIRLCFNTFFRLFVSPFVCSIISSVIYASCMHIRSFVRLFIRLLFNSIVCMFIRITIYDRTDQMRRRIIIRNSHIPVSISLTVYISIPSFDYPFV